MQIQVGFIVIYKILRKIFISENEVEMQNNNDKAIKWKISLDGDDYEIKVILSPWTGKHKIYVDDEPVVFETPAIISFVSGFDQYIKIGENNIFIVCRGGKLDLSINGKMRSTNKPFVPMPAAPVWMWVLCALCLPMPIAGYFINPKLLPLFIAIAIASVLGCIYFAMKADKDERTRARMTTIVMFLPWVIFVLMPLFTKFFSNVF